MNLFSSGPIEAANQEANARMNPVRQQDLEAGLFSGIPTAAGQAIGGVINRPAMIAADTLTPMLTPMAKSLDRVFKSDLNGFLLREQEKTHQAARDLTPDPAVVGWVGQNLIYGGASILGDVAVGTLATGNPFAGLAYAAGAQGYQAYGGAKDSGLNTQTALGMAGITGASTFLGGFMPVWLGQGVATNLMGRAMLAEVSGKAAAASGLYGAASLAAVASTNTAAKLATAGLMQTATGIPTRASISALLEANGYPDMAKQYHAFSLSEMVSDFAIGSIFGLGVHGYQKAFVDRVPPAKPSDLNAALALNNASHVELGTAPGIPVTPEARAAHVEAVNKAISDLLGDRPVEVGDGVTKADFIENPSAAETRAQIVRVVEQHMGPEWEGLQAQLRERGLPENTELYDIQPGSSPVRVTDNVRGMIAEFEKTGDTGALLERLRTLGGKLEQRVDANAAKAERDLTRGNLWIRERLIRAERNGEITPEAHTLVKWLLDNNPAIADELGISFRKGGGGASGTYNPFQKLITLFKDRGNDLTAAHEVLHHTERMMPEAVRDGIREEWINQLHALQKWASENQVHDLMRAIDDVIRATAGDVEAAKRVNDLIKDGTLPYEFYQYVNPSEFWAVNAARLVADRAGAKGWVAKAVQWLKEFIEKAKSAFGLNSDAAIIRGLDAVLKSDGKISGNMLLQGGMSFNDIARGKAGKNTVAQGRIRRTVDSLVNAAESQKSWKTWYARHEQALMDLFGSDADLFQKLLSATSQATGVKGNVTLALKAYGQLLEGVPFDGYLPAVKKNLERIKASEELQGAKISQYGKANEGDTGAIAVDRHIAMLFFNVRAPSAKQIESAKNRIREIAGRLGWAPREVQAALWAFNQVRLGKDPAKVESYDTILKDRAEFIADIRARYGRGEGDGLSAGGRTAEGNTEGSAGKPGAGRGSEGLTYYRGRVADGPLRMRGGVAYFTDNQSAARSYIEQRQSEGYDGPTSVMSAKLQLKNPATEADIRRIAEEKGIELLHPDYPAAYLDGSPELVAALKKAGYDGATGLDGRPDTGAEINSVAVFDRSSIQEIGSKKSADSTILSERPDLVVPSDNGEPMLARDILAQSDAEIAQAKQDSQGYDAAVACALRG